MIGNNMQYGNQYDMNYPGIPNQFN